MIREAQTSIDECVDGSWDAMLWLASNFIGRRNFPTYMDAARALNEDIINSRKEQKEQTTT